MCRLTARPTTNLTAEVVANSETFQFDNGHKLEIQEVPAGFNWAKSPSCPPCCEESHFGYLHRGAVKVKYDNGKEEIIEAGQHYLIKAGHACENVGNEAAVMIEYD